MAAIAAIARWPERKFHLLPLLLFRFCSPLSRRMPTTTPTRIPFSKGGGREGGAGGGPSRPRIESTGQSCVLRSTNSTCKTSVHIRKWERLRRSLCRQFGAQLLSESLDDPAIRLARWSGQSGEGRRERERRKGEGEGESTWRACVCGSAAQESRWRRGEGEGGWVGVYRLISDMCMRAPGRREGRRGGIGRQVNGLREREQGAGSITG